MNENPEGTEAAKTVELFKPCPVCQLIPFIGHAATCVHNEQGEW